MKNLSGKPYFEGNPERKTFTLAVVRAVFGQSQCPFYNLITKTQNCSASGRGTRLSQGVCSFPQSAITPLYAVFVVISFPAWGKALSGSARALHRCLAGCGGRQSGACCAPYDSALGS